MKKILLTISCLLFINICYAEENKINLVMKDDTMVYESNLNNNIFINHTDMLPGDSFTDEVKISNNTDKQVKIFFKVKTREQSESANKLLDNITMKLYLDNKLLYNGKVVGIDNGQVNLQNAIELKLFNSNDSAKLKVETSLLPTYDELNADLSKLDFVLYGQYDGKEEEIVPVPITDKNETPYWVFSSIVCLIGIAMIIYSVKSSKKDS